MGDPWRPSHSLRVFLIEGVQETGIGEVRPGNPGPVLWSIPHPVDQVLEPPFPAAGRQDLADLPDQVATLEDSGRRRCGGRRGQGAGGYGFNLRHVKHGMYLEGGGEQETEGRGVNHLLDHVRPHVSRGQFAGESR